MPKATFHNIGTMLRKRRGTRGVREVAKEIGISPATYSRTERGNQPDLNTFTNVCKWLGVDPKELLGMDPSASRESTATAPVISAHFRASRITNDQLVTSLAELIVAAQSMMTEDSRNPEEL